MESIWKKILVGSSLRRTLVRSLWLGLGTAIAFGVFLRPVQVRGLSMAPTVSDGEFHLASRWWIDAQRTPRRGDIVIVRRPAQNRFYLKRVIGLPGESIAFENGILLINGAPHPEPWVLGRSDWTLPPLKLGMEEFFVAGDNRSMPIYEHVAGVVHRSRLAGRLIW